MVQSMLTTVDNPFDPFIEFDSWARWDEKAGYHTLALLARVVVTSSELSEADQDVAIEQAIEEIVQENVTGMFKKISKEVP